MMKKTLAAVAVLGAFATSAFAADVTIYGRIGTGLLFQDQQATNFDGVDTVDNTSWGMDAGVTTTNRLGFKGSEKISDDLEVGFVLETKLVGDTGSAFANGFDRESLIYAKTNYGSFYAGRVGAMWSDGGSTNFWCSNYVAGGTGGGRYTLAGSNLMVSVGGRQMNRLSYVSPTFAGFTLYGEYSFGTTDDGENTASVDRPAALGLKYANGPFGAGLVVSYNNEASNGALARNTDRENEFTVNLGTHYDAGFADFKLAGQYFQGAQSVGYVTSLMEDSGALGDGYFDKYDDLGGYGFVAGADIPAWGGKWTVSLAYTDAESDDADVAGFDHTAEYENYNAVIGLLKYF